MNVFAGFFATMLGALAIAALVFVWARRDSHHLALERWMRWGDRIADRVFLACVAVFFLVLTALALLRYHSFHTGYFVLSTSWDLGQYNQLIWNSLRGDLLTGTFVLDTRTFLGKSFTPILLAFVPLYALWSDSQVLLIVQAAGLAFAALPLYWYARARLGRVLGLTLGVAYLLSPAVANIGLTEFHEISLAVPLLSLATFFLLRQHHAGFFVSLVATLLVKEEIALIAMAFGGFIFLAQRRRFLGLGLTAGGMLWLVLLLQVLIPFFRGPEFGSTFYYFGEGAIGGGGSRYGYLGRSVPEIALNILTHPEVLWSQLFVPDKLAYVLHLFVPLGMVSLFGIEVVALAVPTLGYSLLSTYPLQYSIQSYYFAPLLAFVFFATVPGLVRLRDWSASVASPSAARRAASATMILTASVLTYAFHSPLPFGGYFQPWRYTLTAHDDLGMSLIEKIPSDAIVIAQNEFLAALSNRRQVYEPPMIPDSRQADYVFGDSSREWYVVHRAGWETYAREGFFTPIVEREGYWVARPREPDHLVNARFGALELLGYSIVPTGTLRGKMDLRPVLAWRATEPINERLRIALRVVDARGHVWASEEREPHDAKSPTNTWRVNKVVNDQYTLRLPPTMPTGEYTILVQVREQEIELAHVRVEKNKSSFTASELYIEHPLQVDMREMRLLGFVPPRETMAPGELMQLGLYWRARAKPQGDYTVAIQLRDRIGKIAFEHAARPANDAYPTPTWNAGEVLLDWHDFDLPREVAPGEYQIFIALRERQAILGQTLIANVIVK